VGILEDVVEGVVSLPFNSIEAVTFEFSSGQTIMLEGNSALAWWSAYLQMLQTMHSIQYAGPLVTSEMVHDSNKEG